MFQGDERQENGPKDLRSLMLHRFTIASLQPEKHRGPTAKPAGDAEALLTPSDISTLSRSEI